MNSDMLKAMAILIIRHGETALNAARVVQVPDTPLSETGLEQARRLGERLASFTITKLVSSDYARAYMTAQAVHAHTGIDIEINEQLRERNFGDIRGTPYSELTVDILDQQYEPPNGESIRVFDERVANAWRQITSLADTIDGDLAVVTHGLVCRSLARHQLANCPPIDDEHLGFHNTSLTIVEAQAPWPVTRFACIEHLAGMVVGGAAV